ncbi:MAG: hypothetical protein QOK21_3632 [Solirubrobacteraceae bacterium]|jgi:hypothetical protein|nr:hypothetical protein [Solirubrobacteraceae bacterium]
MTADVSPIDDVLVRPPRGRRPRLRPLEIVRWCRATDSDTLRAAVWALRACRRIHSTPEARGLVAPDLPRVPAVAPAARRGVEHVLWLRAEQCLVTASVRQAWLAARADEQDVVIGVAVDRPARLRAHAWLSGAPEEGAGYEEIARVPPRGAG